MTSLSSEQLRLAEVVRDAVDGELVALHADRDGLAIMGCASSSSRAMVLKLLLDHDASADVRWRSGVVPPGSQPVAGAEAGAQPPSSDPSTGLEALHLDVDDAIDFAATKPLEEDDLSIR